MSPLRPLCAFIVSEERAFGLPLYTLPRVGSNFPFPFPLPLPFPFSPAPPCGKLVRGASKAPAFLCSSDTTWFSSSTCPKVGKYFWVLIFVKGFGTYESYSYLCMKLHRGIAKVATILSRLPTIITLMWIQVTSSFVEKCKKEHLGGSMTVMPLVKSSISASSSSSPSLSSSSESTIFRAALMAALAVFVARSRSKLFSRHSAKTLLYSSSASAVVTSSSSLASASSGSPKELPQPVPEPLSYMR